MSEITEPLPKPPNAFSGQALATNKSFLILVGVVIAVALGALLWLWQASQFEKTDNATLVGHVHPVAPRVAGTIAQVLVEDDQAVQKGDVIAVIDNQDYALMLSQAQSHLLNAKAQAKTAFSNIAYTQRQAASQVTQAQGVVGASQSTIAQSRQAVAEARAAVSQARHLLEQQAVQYQKAQSDYARYKGADPEAISAQQLETAFTALKGADAAQNSAQANLRQAEARLAQTQSSVSGNVSKLTQSQGVAQSAQAQTLQLAVVKAQYDAALASVQMAEDEVRQAQLNVGYTRILAPVSGKIGKKSVEVGQRVQPGELLMAVVSPEVWVVANYKETQLSRMRPGQSVEIEVDAFPSHHFEGVVNSFSPASGAQFALLPAENATGNFTKIVQRIPVKILLKPDSVKGYENLLVPGMSTVVSVKVSQPSQRKPAS
ncbi:HlyD family secretion protein [Vampirovibrio sp.]|uniref:HlyD family secretion protein n=1 Tax=Vampirovibrio sp. TaxID=2717857 RepID=UPI00359422BF